MKSKPRPEQLYSPALAKTFPNVVSHWLAEEFPHLGGPKVRELFVTELMGMIEAYYLPVQRLQPGQTVWYAVDKNHQTHAESMAEIRLVPVILTMVAREDIVHLFQGVPLSKVRQEVIARLHREADAQGGTLAELDTSLLLCQSQTTIAKAVRAYEQEHGCIIPRRGTVHDIGRSVTHKAIIAKKAFLEAKQAPDVAWEAAHSLPATERYLVALMRVYISLKRRGMTLEETAFATGMSISLVKEYAALITELGLTDEQLSGIMASLERAAHTRQSEREKIVASDQPAPGVPILP